MKIHCLLVLLAASLIGKMSAAALKESTFTQVVNDANRQTVNRFEKLLRQFVRKRIIFADMNFFAFDGFQRNTVEPDARFITARAECQLRYFV